MGIRAQVLSLSLGRFETRQTETYRGALLTIFVK